tara:strand:+ start:4540 stop:5844 length:1305 start_codon:yes stop_codon:yes gene_type:complete
MVFGWGKKKQVVEETREKPVLPTHKEATLENIPDILEDITNLRQKTLVIEVKSFQKRIEVDRKTLLLIADELGKDSLNTNEMDPHLVLLVNRGKKEVISSIQNEFKGTFPEINSFDNVLGFQRNASRGIKKVGDMLGKHSRVIHIFAKKYAKKLKGDLGILTDNLSEVNELISNYNSNQELLESIRHSLSDFSNIKKDIEKQERRKMELEKSIEEEQQNEAKLQKDIEEMESSNNYKEFLDIKENITSVSVEEKSIKKKIEEQFLKISRPLNKYVYVSALDKPLKKITENLTLSPYDVLSAENMLDIKKILDAVRSGIESGSVSVKDVEKSKQSINDIQDLLPQLIAQKAEFIQKRDKLNESLTIFDNDRLVTLTHNLEKSRFNISDRESKISIIRQQIDSSKSSVHDMISKLELNLKQASSISYKISYSENDF